MKNTPARSKHVMLIVGKDRTFFVMMLYSWIIVSKAIEPSKDAAAVATSVGSAKSTLVVTVKRLFIRLMLAFVVNSVRTYAYSSRGELQSMLALGVIPV